MTVCDCGWRRYEDAETAPCDCWRHLVRPRTRTQSWHCGRCQRVISDDEISDDEIGRALRAYLRPADRGER